MTTDATFIVYFDKNFRKLKSEGSITLNADSSCDPLDIRESFPFIYAMESIFFKVLKKERESFIYPNVVLAGMAYRIVVTVEDQSLKMAFYENSMHVLSRQIDMANRLSRDPFHWSKARTPSEHGDLHYLESFAEGVRMFITSVQNETKLTENLEANLSYLQTIASAAEKYCDLRNQTSEDPDTTTT